ncbi:hypothetical protein [Caldibacillus debilis]|uniref:hypothetical protein n=1 Tax=Caldibacillus debilis TaxID=301148 RepID=UPI0007799F0B|nr:hypothetical protein [Caldibacillus debilis]
MIAAPYVRTLLGWFNVTIDGKRYNVAPDVFRSIAGVSDRAQYGIAELTAAEAEALIRAGIAL